MIQDENHEQHESVIQTLARYEQRIADLDDAYAVQRDAKEQLVERIAELEALARLVVDDPVQINLQRLEQALGGDDGRN